MELILKIILTIQIIMFSQCVFKKTLSTTLVTPFIVFGPLNLLNKKH
jgi:hypothetical protein